MPLSALSDKFNQRIVMLITALALFMESLDTTIINTAIPAMAHSLAVNPIKLKIALISYLLSLAIFVPISGWIADKFGAKRIFIIACVIFTLSSFWCGFAHSLFSLVAARTVQGLGGALMLPVARLLILRIFQRHELLKAMNQIILVAALATMFGPVIGGFITHHFSWRWIFWVNIPVGLLTIAMAQYWLKQEAPQIVPPLDKWGFIFFGVGLAGLTFGLSAFSEPSFSDWLALLILLSAILFLAIYVWHSRRRLHPIVNMALLRIQTFQISLVGNLCSRLGFAGLPFLLPLLLQVGLGYSAQTSGLLLAPVALGIIVFKPLSLPLLRFLGYRRYLLLNTTLVALSLTAFTLINGHTTMYLIASLTFIFGALMTLQYSGMNSLAYAQIKADDLSAATSIMSTTQQLAQSFGVAIGALFIRYFSPGVSAEFSLTVTVFHHAFLAMGAMTLLSALIFMRLTNKDGAELLEK
jgi:EmrB/QacA subfamily drug resistance transporter